MEQDSEPPERSNHFRSRRVRVRDALPAELSGVNEQEIALRTMNCHFVLATLREPTGRYRPVVLCDGGGPPAYKRHHVRAMDYATFAQVQSNGFVRAMRADGSHTAVPIARWWLGHVRALRAGVVTREQLEAATSLDELLGLLEQEHAGTTPEGALP